MRWLFRQTLTTLAKRKHFRLRLTESVDVARRTEKAHILVPFVVCIRHYLDHDVQWPSSERSKDNPLPFHDGSWDLGEASRQWLFGPDQHLLYALP